MAGPNSGLPSLLLWKNGCENIPGALSVRSGPSLALCPAPPAAYCLGLLHWQEDTASSGTHPLSSRFLSRLRVNIGYSISSCGPRATAQVSPAARSFQPCHQTCRAGGSLPAGQAREPPLGVQRHRRPAASRCRAMPSHWQQHFKPWVAPGLSRTKFRTLAAFAVPAHFGYPWLPSLRTC